jgi:hypothetical protein
MKSLLIFTIMVLAAVPSCNDDEEIPITRDRLEDTGILGKWKLESRAVNGISNLAVECCDYIVFYQDREPDDLSGNFEASGYQYATIGIFTLNLDEESILFQYEDRNMEYTFDLEQNTLNFLYVEDKNEISETWRREP